MDTGYIKGSPPTLVAFDIDGTIAREGRVIPEAKTMLQLIDSRHQSIVLVTARTRFETVRFVAELGLDIRAVCFGGAVLLGKGGEVVQGLPGSIPNREVAWLQDRHGEFVAEGAVEWCCSSPSLYPLARLVLALPSRCERLWPPDFEVRRLVTTRRHLRRGLDSFRRAGVVVATAVNIPVVEIRSSRPTKGEGLAAYARLMGWDLDHALSVGDDVDDISMFEKTRWSVTFSAAPPPAREVAQLHVDSLADLDRLLANWRP